jgi:SAM-dependent methyltransferase
VGQGTDLVQLGKAGARCHGIDITRRHLDLAQHNFALRGLSADLRLCDATSIKFPDESFDCVDSFGVLHHVPEIEACVAEIRRVLKPGGTFYLSLYHAWSKDAFSLLFVQGLLAGMLSYHGADTSSGMIDAGRSRYAGRSDVSFVTDPQTLSISDYTVSSGVFNVRLGYDVDAWVEYVHGELDLMNRLSRRGFAFNMLTIYSDSDRMRDYLYCADPHSIFAHIHGRDNRMKAQGYELASYISPKCTNYAKSIGNNCFIFEDNTLQPFVTIGNDVTLWSGNHIGHHSTVQSHLSYLHTS